MNQQHQRTVFLTQIGILTAVILLLEISGLGMFKTFGLELTILQVPVIVAAIVLGPTGGITMGLVFGLVSFYECFGKSAFGSALLSINPILTFLVCVPPRVLMGWLCGLIFKGLNAKLQKRKVNFWAYVISSLSGALLNTVFFMSALCICFYQTEYIQGFVEMLGSSNIFSFVIGFVGVQGLVEALLCATLGTAISKPVRYALYKK